ncbi:MAG: SDR family oxidoreductase [Alphaproteobacteria bacterium]|nr:SDR family oxidoreductase [Alphaproteobacteria bacterium]
MGTPRPDPRLALPLSPALPRTALVTGGAKRLGRAITLALAQAGFAVAIHYHRSAAEAAALAEEARRLGVKAGTRGADLAREEEVAPLLPRAAGLLGGPIGVLVNNASTFERDTVHDATRASWDLRIEPNLRAPFVLAQAFARDLPDGAEGVILNLLDQRVWSVTPYFVSYTVSKVGLWALTQQLALALAPRIRVNAIGPGPALPSARQSDAQFARQCASTPLQRGTSPEEVARALLAILALPAMTGQMIALDGGQHLQWAPAHGHPPHAPAAAEE